MMRNVFRSWMWFAAAVVLLPMAAYAVTDEQWDGTLDFDQLNGCTRIKIKINCVEGFQGHLA